MPVDIGNGVMADTVGDLLSPPSEFMEVDSALVMPRLPTTPPELPCGIHFGIPEEDYHKIAAFSKSHLRNLLASETIFWEDSWLNPHRKEKDKDHFTLGKAYHAMILEGHDAYTSRFYPEPDPDDYPKALRMVDQIKQALEALDHKPVTRVDVEGQEGKTRAAVKADWVEQLVKADRSAEVWDDIEARAVRIAAGRTLIPVEADRRIRLAARMIQSNVQLTKAFSGGYPEVTLIWRDPRLGVLCKCRCDYLKIKAVVDLKSYANQQQRSARNAIIRTIAENRYPLQPAVYLQGVDEVRKLVRQHKDAAIFYHGEMADDDVAVNHAKDFAHKWASNTAGDRWLFVFQAKGMVPVTRGMWWPLGGTVHSIAQNLFLEGLRKFREAADIYGTDPWLDLAEIDELGEEEIPAWGLEI